MVQLTTPEALHGATKRAKASRLFVQPTSIFRQYRVTNRENGNLYVVNFFVRDGRRFGHCTCKAGQNHVACKHLAAAAGLHVCLAAQLKSA